MVTVDERLREAALSLHVSDQRVPSFATLLQRRGRRRGAIVTISAICCIGALFAIAASAQPRDRILVAESDSTSSSPPSTDDAGGGQNLSDSPQWLAGDGVPTDGANAYLSQPIDITNGGEYQLVFGPVEPADVARFQSNIAVSLPSDITFAGAPIHGSFETWTIDQKLYARLKFNVRRFDDEYDGLRVWLY
jgi:hypothetical protein